MAPKGDPRSQDVKARISWHLGWMGERDSQGDKLGDWAEHVDSWVQGFNEKTESRTKAVFQALVRV